MTRATPIAEALLVHAAFVRRIAGALVGPQAADDLCQDAFVAALQHGPVAVPADAAASRSWLATVVRNLFRNQRRGELRRTARERAVAAGAAVPAVDEIVAREELRRRVVDAVLALPADLRDVVLLRYYEDLDSAEIGRRLGRPPGTVRWQLQRAVHSLRQQLDGERGGRGWVLPLVWWERARLGSLTALRIAWPLRALGAAVLLLGVAWLALPGMLGSPPPLAPGVPVPIAAASGGASDAATAAPGERQRLAIAAATPAHGPETLWGTVVRDADGAPIADAVVELQYSDADQFDCLDQDYARQVATLATVHTDAAGQFSFGVARAQQHRLRVIAAGAAPRVVFGCVGGALIEVRVAPGAVIEGVVRAATTGEPIGDAEVTLGWHDRGVDASVRTAGDGSFRVSDVAAGSVLVQVSARGWARGTKRVASVAGGTQQVAITLERGRTVRGRVLDAVAKMGIGGAEVADSREFERSVRTGADGSYELPGVGRTAVVHVRASGFASALRAVPSEAGDCALDFGLVHGATLRGRIVDPAGAPVPQAFVGCCTEYLLRDAGSVQVDWQRAKVGADGRFVLTAVSALAQALYVRGPGFGARSYGLGMHGNDESRDLGDLVLRPAAIVEGRLLDGERRPIVGAWIGLSGGNADATSAFVARLVRDGVPKGATWNTSEVFPGASMLVRRTVQTASDGSFRFANLSAGTYRLEVTLGDLQLLRYEGQQGDPMAIADGEVRTGIEIVMSAANAISGHVLAEGVALAGSLLLAQSEAGDVTSVGITADAKFEFRGAAGDTYSLVAMKLPAGYALSPCRGIRVPARDVELRLQRALPIEGRVVDAQGRGTAATVFVWFAGVKGPPMYDTAADGSFVLDVAPDYVGRISASRITASHGKQKAAVDPVAAGTRDLVLRLQ